MTDWVPPWDRGLPERTAYDWPEPELSAPEAEPHWACDDCGQPCRCVGALRELPHVACGHREFVWPAVTHGEREAGGLHELNCTNDPCRCEEVILGWIV